MSDASDFLSCDWGTTSFRLRWVCGTDRSIIREVREQAGVKALYEQALVEGAFTEEERAGVFTRFLREKIAKLMAGETADPRHMSLVISGMASSSVGWRELPYANTPFALDGKGLRFEEMKWNAPAWIGRTYLLSGVATPHDIMRGEELETIGLMSEPSLASARAQCLLILPGTHSKHVWIEHESVVDFRTWMTGELFTVMGKHSLLRASVDLDAPESASFSEDHRLAFQEGVLWAKQHGLAEGLFRVRTRSVLEQRPIPDNTAFFSGLLIGAELRHLLRLDGGDTRGDTSPVILGAAGRLSGFYAAALDILLSESRPWQRVSSQQVERATVAGHAIFLGSRHDSRDD
ncbi:MAG: 2-dehydro-3-deoxygalactonokinase [Verrucomicrobiales bacterium]|nr:2-dehydro-3-deoxygalactonokinase [Verrucomicrobiales bacterium]